MIFIYACNSNYLVSMYTLIHSDAFTHLLKISSLILCQLTHFLLRFAQFHQLKMHDIINQSPKLFSKQWFSLRNNYWLIQKSISSV